MPSSSVCRLIACGLAAAPFAALANPVFPGADPHVEVFGDSYWAYPTHATNPEAQFHSNDFVAYSSPDLVNWTASKPILKIEDISWIKEDGAKDHWLWAPGITEKDGKYFFYYSVGPQNPTPSRIGVAVGDSPGGVFKDIGKPLVTGGKGWEAIDPMVFHDKDGTSYLYVGGSNGAKLKVWKLKPSLTELGEEIEVETPEQFTEGAFMQEIDGTYYLSYSHGGWNNPNYSVHYATGKSATGPWTYQGAILNSNDTHKGPGHHSFFQNPKSGQWFICYHYWNPSKGDGPLGGIRDCAIQPVTFTKDGKIEVVVPTHDGPEASPLR